MSRVVLIAVALLAIAGAVVWYFGLASPAMSGPEISTTLYDTDASGSADLTRQRIGDQAVLWTWDRDDDGEADVTAYDATLSPEGILQPTGAVTAWDFGADGVLDSGEVPGRLQELLRSPAYQEAVAMAGVGNVELVDAEIREFVDALAQGFDDWRLADFRMPIVGARLPDADRLLPGAQRAYRYGVHQGFDMYGGHVGVPTGYGGPVVAAKDGEVIRADVDYVEMTAEEHDEAIAISRDAGTTPPAQLDLLRGRQVWIDHGHGIVTRYCHLSAIAPGITQGTTVEGGDVIAFVGNSGMESASRGGDSGAHLHFELRIDGRYLGEGMSPDEIRQVAGRIFDVLE